MGAAGEHLAARRRHGPPRRGDRHAARPACWRGRRSGTRRCCDWHSPRRCCCLHTSSRSRGRISAATEDWWRRSPDATCSRRGPTACRPRCWCSAWSCTPRDAGSEVALPPNRRADRGSGFAGGVAAAGVLAHRHPARRAEHRGGGAGDLRPGRVGVRGAWHPACPRLHDRDLHGLRRALRPRSRDGPGVAADGAVLSPWRQSPARHSATASSAGRMGRKRRRPLRLGRSGYVMTAIDGRSRRGAGPTSGPAHARGAGQPLDHHCPRRIRRGHREQPPPGGDRGLGRGRRRDVARLRAGPDRYPPRSSRRRRAGRAVRDARHADRRGPDWRVESSRTDGGVVWNRQHAGARLPRAPPPRGRSSRSPPVLARYRSPTKRPRPWAARDGSAPWGPSSCRRCVSGSSLPGSSPSCWPSASSASASWWRRRVTTTLPIRVYTLIANTPASSVAILALLQAGVVLGPLAILAGLLARPGPTVNTAAVGISQVSKRLGSHPALTAVSLVVPSGRCHGDPRPEWLRQDDAAAPHRRPRGAGCRHHHHPRHAGL